MMQRKVFLLFLSVLMNVHSFANPIHDSKIERAIYEERYVTALQLLQSSFKNAPYLENDSLSYYLYQTADCLFKIRATEHLETILNMAENHKSLISPYYLAKLTAIKANYLKDKGDFNLAETLIITSIKNCSFADVRIDYMLSLASLHIINGHSEKALTLYRNIESSSAKTKMQTATALNGIGACFNAISVYDSARQYYTTALELHKIIFGNNHTKTAQVNYNLALLDNKFGNYSASEKKLHAILKIYRNKLGEKHIRTAEAYGTLGSIYLLQDDLQKALYYITKERDLLSALYNKKHPDIAYSYLNTGKIYFFQHDLKNAELQLNTGITLLTELQQTNNSVYLQLNIELSKVLYKKKDYRKSNELLKQLLTTQKPDDEFTADIYLQMAENYLLLKETEKAAIYFNLSENIYSAIYGKQNLYSIDVWIGLSNCFLQKKNYLKASEYAAFATSKTILNNKIIFPYDHWECKLQEIICMKELLKQDKTHNHSIQKIKEEIETIKLTLQEANQIKQTYYSAGSQLYYVEKMTELNQLGIYFLTHFYNKTDVYFLDNLLFFAENNKANLLRNKIINYKATEILPLAEKAKSSVITGRLNYFISLNENLETLQYNINDSILFYQNLYETFSKSIEKKYPKIYRLKYGEKPLTAKQIQEKLVENQTFLEYISDNERYYLLAISKKNITYKICGDKQHIDSLISLQSEHTILQKSNSDINKQIAKHLLPTTMFKELIISPDGKIHFLAFDMLPTETEKLLVYEHPTQFAFSANTYFNHQPNNEKKNVIAFYPDFSTSSYAVLNSTKEHNALKLFSNYNVYHQQNATKSNFIKTANNTGIIHIASHLIIDTISPLYSYLVFQPSQNSTLSIHEIWKLSTNTQLISLACCQSNFGKQQSGEGVQNFAWAFHYAGAHNILSTQWNAPDKSTSAIISDFYRNLHAGISKQEALRLAKMSYLEKADAIGKEPFFWANLNLYGDKSAIVIHPYFFVKFWWIPVLVLLLCYLAIVTYNKLYRKKKYDHL
jgi:CHAT domain-containing protein/lipopolysaccharide biosynthesis regulator YciM